MMLGPVLIAAGGTGGHLFPAEALASALTARGIAVELVTDNRAVKYTGAFATHRVHILPAATPTGGSFFGKLKALWILLRGTLAARSLIRDVQPSCMVGFGGYPTVAPLTAASQLGVPTILHEQNAVMGRANRFLVNRADRIATGFKALEGISSEAKLKCVQTGNPVRPAVLEAANLPYPQSSDRLLHILVTGGSQGARVMADIVPAAIELIFPELRNSIRIVQQARGEDAERVTQDYKRMKIEAVVKPFFDDLPARIAAAHLVISRAGASTVSELAVIGRASILVPFPHALDQDQAANAEQLAETGAAEIIRQIAFTPERLAKLIDHALADPDLLMEKGQSARTAGRPDAAERLADLVLETIALRQPNRGRNVG